MMISPRADVVLDKSRALVVCEAWSAGHDVWSDEVNVCEDVD